MTLGDQIIRYRLPVSVGGGIKDLLEVEATRNVIEDQVVHPVNERIVAERRAQKCPELGDLDYDPGLGFPDLPSAERAGSRGKLTLRFG